MTTRRGAGALVIASLLWGTTGTAASALPDAVTPIAVGAATMTVGGAALFLTAASSAIRVLRDRSSRKWVVLGAVGVFVYPLAFYSGMDLAGVAVGNVTALGSGPLFAALLEWVIDRDRPTRRWFVAAALAVIGVILLPLGVSRSDADASTHLLPGVLLGLVAGAAYALYTYCSSAILTLPGRVHSGRAVMGAVFGVGAALLSPVLVATGAPLLEDPTSVSLTLYLAAGPMFVAYLLFGYALATVRSSAATTITLLEPVVATLLAVLIVGERLSPLGVVAIVLILGGVLLLSSARRDSAASRST